MTPPSSGRPSASRSTTASPERGPGNEPRAWGDQGVLLTSASLEECTTMGVNSHANDAMIRRLESELEERNAFVQGTVANAQDAERDLNDTERATLAEARSRMKAIQDQLVELESTAELAKDVARRAKDLDLAITTARRTGSAEVEYRSSGGYLVDYIDAAIGSKSAMERLELYTRAAAHQKTTDNLGVVPDPIFGDVLNFIDTARPIVGVL